MQNRNVSWPWLSHRQSEGIGQDLWSLILTCAGGSTDLSGHYAYSALTIASLLSPI